MTRIDTHAQWHYSDACLTLSGIWQAEQVAQAWRELSIWQGVQRVDLTAVTKIDSALIALLVKLRSAIDQTLLLSGVSDFVRSLLKLYEVDHLFFEVLHHES